MTKLDRDLDIHRGLLRACRRCALGAGVEPIVSLARSPRAMLVGQAPGKVEAGGGAPFSGRAGRTLFNWFASVGLHERTIRERVYISAITRCFPGPHPAGRGDRVPSNEERARCSDWLSAELRIIRPRLIIPVGRLAIDEFLGPIPLDAVIGREHEIPLPDFSGNSSRSALVIPLPHPSGASSWVHAPAHKELLGRALTLIARRWKDRDGRRVA